MLGHGDATFQPPIYYAVDAADVYAGDLIGDGIPDLRRFGSFRMHTCSATEIVRSRLPCSLVPMASLFYTESPLALADFNRDGKLDIAAIDSTASPHFSTPPRRRQPLPSFQQPASPTIPIPDSIATAFGQNFPTTGASVSITDSSAKLFRASVVSANQINLVIPPGLDAGPATLSLQSASVLIAPVAPSLFTVNVDGLAAGYITQGSANHPIYMLKNGVYTPVPIDVTSGQTCLILFGTGLRNGAGFQIF